jgi:hypothetical protein
MRYEAAAGVSGLQALPIFSIAKRPHRQEWKRFPRAPLQGERSTVSERARSANRDRDQSF